MKKRGKLNPKITPLLIGFLLILITLMFARPELTGKVLSVPSTPASCSSQEINTLWESNFKESYSNIIIFNNSACQKIGAYKITNKRANILIFKKYNAYNQFEFLSTNLSEEGLSFIKNITSTDNLTNNMFEEYLSYYALNREVDANSALTEYNLLFKQTIEVPRLETHGDGNFYIYNESNQTSYLRAIIMQNKSFIEFLIETNTQSYCTPNITVITTSCSADDTSKTRYIDMNGCLNTAVPAEITNSCDYDSNGIIGTFTSFGDINLNLTLFIGGETPNSSIIYNITKTIEFKDGSLTRVKFDYNFSSPLNLRNITIKKQPSSYDYGYLIVKGIPLSKTLTIDRISNSANQICAVNKEIDDIDEISNDCDESQEYLIDCPGNNSFITCNISGSNFIVSGLTNSAVKEINNGSTISCISNWSCSLWTPCANKQQTRLCVDTQNCNSLIGKPTESQTCACNPNWVCSLWSPEQCPKNQTQIRVCTDSNNCNTNEGKDSEKQTCTYESPINYKMSLWILAIIFVLLIIILIIYFIIKDLNKSKQKENNIIIAKPQEPPIQMPINPYQMQKPIAPQKPANAIPEQKPNTPLEKQPATTPKQQQVPKESAQEHSKPEKQALLPENKDNSKQTP